MKQLTRTEKEKKKQSEMRKLNKIFKNLSENNQIYANELIDKASFMSVTLQELQETITDTTTIELYQNGRQELIREHPASKAYNSMIKSYLSVIKILQDMTPEEEEVDELLEFLDKRK